MSAWELTRADVGNALALIGEAMRPHLGHEHKINLVHAALIAGAGPAIAALQLENAALKPLEKERDCYASACEHLNATIATLQRRVAQCEAALKPFAQAADDLHDILVDGCEIWETPAAMGITAGDLRRAQAVLASVQEQPK